MQDFENNNLIVGVKITTFFLTTGFNHTTIFFKLID